MFFSLSPSLSFVPPPEGAKLSSNSPREGGREIKQIYRESEREREGGRDADIDNT
jgi:hypothetical protein